MHRSERVHQTPFSTIEPQLNRQRAFALLLEAYDTVRRGITYLRWEHGDADEIAPSLYAGRSGPRKTKDEDEPAALPSTPVVPVLPIGPAPAVVALGNANIPVGMPGSNPFV